MRHLTREIAVLGAEPPPLRATSGSVWPVRDEWNRGTENLYSAWIEKLFDAPLDQELSWPALHEVLRDKSRNFLFNHLGLGEDEKKLIYQPDCADLPYFLARVLRVQDGAAVRVLEVLARRRRRGAASARSGGTFRTRSRPPAPEQQPRPAACSASTSRSRVRAQAPPRPSGLVPRIRILCAHDRRRRRAFRQRPHGAGR